MSQLVESLRRLYASGKLALDKLNEMRLANKITEEEYHYIIQ